MHIAILGRLPALSMAELEQLYGSSSIRWFSDISALIESPHFDFERLGGTQKAGNVVLELSGDWRHASMQIVKHYTHTWSSRPGKVTLGISAYGFNVNARDVQKTGIILKSKLREHGSSLRLIPNTEAALSSATSHHNKLGLSDNHVELLVVRAANGRIIVAESVGAQNITALAARDQARPKRDAFVGMLPPKLARMMVNMTGVASGTVLDPFCGTGVILQEAALIGRDIYGTDLSEKMVDYSTQNIDWLTQRYKLGSSASIEQGDAMSHTWQRPLDAVATETYLGQPFSAPPSPQKLREVVGNCDHIISSFLQNISRQLTPGTPLCVAIPAWRDKEGYFTHLPLTKHIDDFGLTYAPLKHVHRADLLYYRENQVVARELLVLYKK